LEHGCLVVARASNSVRDISKCFYSVSKRYRDSVETVSGAVEAVSMRVETVFLRCYEAFTIYLRALWRCYSLLRRCSTRFLPRFAGQSKGFSCHSRAKKVVLGMLWVWFGSAWGLLRVS
jgi:hypothetical protein